jgi:hypothetical protein
MKLFKKIANRPLLPLQFILISIFIIFIEIIWERLAEPIYHKIQQLRVLQRLKIYVDRADRYTTLTIFIALLLSVEGAGLVAGVLFVQGQVIFGTLLYAIKIPIAGFTFWLFKVSKSKLLSFNWFSLSYNRLTGGIEWLKSTDIYKSSLKYISEVKTTLKKIRLRYFSKESHFIKDTKAFYRYIKNLKNRNI